MNLNKLFTQEEKIISGEKFSVRGSVSLHNNSARNVLVVRLFSGQRYKIGVFYGKMFEYYKEINLRTDIVMSPVNYSVELWHVMKHLVFCYREQIGLRVALMYEKYIHIVDYDIKGNEAFRISCFCDDFSKGGKMQLSENGEYLVIMLPYVQAIQIYQCSDLSMKRFECSSFNVHAKFTHLFMSNDFKICGMDTLSKSMFIFDGLDCKKSKIASYPTRDHRLFQFVGGSFDDGGLFLDKNVIFGVVFDAIYSYHVADESTRTYSYIAAGKLDCFYVNREHTMIVFREIVKEDPQPRHESSDICICDLKLNVLRKYNCTLDTYIYRCFGFAGFQDNRVSFFVEKKNRVRNLVSAMFCSFNVPTKSPPWDIQRLLWTAHFNEEDVARCPMSMLCSDNIRDILSYCRVDLGTEWKLE